jgi:hypothetical protein
MPKTSRLEEIREQKKEKDQGEGEQIHHEAEDDAGVVKIAAWGEAAESVDGPEGGQKCGDEEQRMSLGAGKSGEQIGGEEAAQNEGVGADEGRPTSVEDGEG